MCGRFANHVTEFGDWEAFMQVWPDAIETGYNVAPTTLAPVITAGSTITARWGLVPHWSKQIDDRYATFNARVETMAEKPTYRDAWKRGQRCLVPALGYYEWQKLEDGKQPYFIRARSQPMLMFGGLWEHWNPDEESVHSFTIITLPADGELKDIHHRMPLMLSPTQADDWLNGSVKDASKLTLEREISTLHHAVSRRVNNPRNDDASLIESG